MKRPFETQTAKLSALENEIPKTFKKVLPAHWNSSANKGGRLLCSTSQREDQHTVL